MDIETSTLLCQALGGVVAQQRERRLGVGCPLACRVTTAMLLPSWLSLLACSLPRLVRLSLPWALAVHADGSPGARARIERTRSRRVDASAMLAGARMQVAGV